MTNRTSHARLSDVQLLLLSAAVNRPDGSLLPPAAALGSDLSDRIRKAITSLIHRSFAEVRETAQADQVWREENGRRIGIVITDAGRAAIADDRSESADKLAAAPVPANDAYPNTDGKAGSKIAAVLTLLKRPEGATLLELVDATEWLPHTIRAAMTGLRKKGYAIERSSRESTTFWYVQPGAQP
jgi:DNA-binding MarR family transcriptional regulator